MNALVVLDNLYGANHEPLPESETYWYHPDHLGSASWVSDKAGKGIQHLYYLPWGEELDNQRATGYASRYTFSGKERDEETGYSYFGARHYNSDLSLWLSVDPMSDKYPGVSPYVYCGNNPVVLKDPDGRDYEVVVDNNSEHPSITIRAVYYTSKEYAEKLQEAVDYWNEQKFALVTHENGESRVYDIVFDLSVNSDYSSIDAASDALLNDNSGFANLFQVGPSEGRGELQGGKNITVTEETFKKQIFPRTICHEIGHSLGMYHTWFDNNVMYGGGDSKYVNSTNIRQCLKGYYKQSWILYFGNGDVGKCHNSVNEKYHGKIIRKE